MKKILAIVLAVMLTISAIGSGDMRGQDLLTDGEDFTVTTG